MAEMINDSVLDEVNGGVKIDGVEYYHVKAGDTLSEIAEKFHVSLAALCAANHISDPHFVQAGTMLVVPERKN